MPVTDSSKKALELASQFISLQQDLELANALKIVEDLQSIPNKIKELEETNLSIWKEVEKEIARLGLEIAFIIKDTNLEEQLLEPYKAKQQAIDSVDIDNLRRTAVYNLVLRLAKYKKQQALEANRLGKRSKFF